MLLWGLDGVLSGAWVPLARLPGRRVRLPLIRVTPRGSRICRVLRAGLRLISLQRVGGWVLGGRVRLPRSTNMEAKS